MEVEKKMSELPLGERIHLDDEVALSESLLKPLGGLGTRVLEPTHLGLSMTRIKPLDDDDSLERLSKGPRNFPISTDV